MSQAQLKAVLVGPGVAALHWSLPLSYDGKAWSVRDALADLDLPGQTNFGQLRANRDSQSRTRV